MTINPKKLINSKWTAVKPINKEKHCLVTKLEIEKNGQVNHCQLMSIHSKRLFLVDLKNLKNPEMWLQGWL